MTKLNLTSFDGLFVSYDFETIKELRHGKARDFFTKDECEDNGVKLTDSILIIKFKNGSSSFFANNWAATFA